MTTESLLAAGADTTAPPPATGEAPTGAAPAATTPVAGSPPAEGTPAGSATAAVEGAPEAYADFTLPEGVALDVAEIGALAKELNLPQDKAQAVVDAASKLVSNAQQQQIETVNTLHADWRQQCKTDKEFGGEKLGENLARAKASMEATATPQLQVLLDRSGLGNHPEVIRHFLQVAPAFLDDKFVPGGTKPPGASKTAAQILYDAPTH